MLDHYLYIFLPSGLADFVNLEALRVSFDFPLAIGFRACVLQPIRCESWRMAGVSDQARLRLDGELFVCK